MAITLRASGRDVEVRTFTFSGGEVQVRLIEPPQGSGGTWFMTAHVHGSDDLMAMLLTADAIRRLDGEAVIRLRIPYLPYARQDRAAWHGEAFSLAVMAAMLKAGRFESLSAWDVHSDVATTLLPGLEVVPARTFVAPVLAAGETVVAPDAGALHRAEACAGGGHRLVRAAKHRDPDTGALCDPRLLDALGADADAIVVDDICDGGRTFLQLGRVLRSQTRGRLRLYVTHGIFSAGIDALLSVYDEVLTANLFDRAFADRVTVLPAPAFG